MSFGRVESIAGAAGGVKYIPVVVPERRTKVLNQIADRMRDPKRIIPGGFLYIGDLLYDPYFMKDVGEIFAEMFSYSGIDYVLTVETKGIPLAMMTANGLNCPLVVARNENRVTEGATISINYVSGSTGQIQTMYVSKNAIKTGSKVLIIDDFMRAGGTVLGLIDLVHELGSTVEGVGVLLETSEPAVKMVSDYTALMTLERVSREEIVVSIK
jgi:purine operon repressor